MVINGRLLNHCDVGLGAYTARLLDGLVRHANPAEVCCLAPAGCTFSFARDMKVVYLPRWPLPSLLADVAFDWLVDRTARSAFPDRLLLHPSPSPFASRPAQTCMVYHDCIPVHFPIYYGKKKLRRLIMLHCDAAARRCRRILTDSEFSRRDIHEHLGFSLDHIGTVPNWLPPHYNPEYAKRGAEQVRRTYTLPARFWLYVGGYDIRKNVEFLLRAYANAKIKAACPALVLAGRIPPPGAYAYCEVYKTIADLHLREGQEVFLPGFIAGADMPGLYGAAELLIYPSRYEGFGLPAMEAMGCGCPAICADNTSLPEVVKDRPYRFSGETTEMLTQLLIRAASEALPMNPSFSRDDFDEKSSILRLLSYVHPDPAVFSGKAT